MPEQTDNRPDVQQFITGCEYVRSHKSMSFLNGIGLVVMFIAISFAAFVAGRLGSQADQAGATPSLPDAPPPPSDPPGRRAAPTAATGPIGLPPSPRPDGIRLAPPPSDPPAPARTLPPSAGR